MFENLLDKAIKVFPTYELVRQKVLVLGWVNFMWSITRYKDSHERTASFQRLQGGYNNIKALALFQRGDCNDVTLLKRP
jgi:hypothetical protein